MKKVFSIISVIVFASFFSSCLEQCEIDDTADITIQNNTEKSLWFDVREFSYTTNEVRSISAGSSTKYTVPSGSVSIFASETSSTSGFVNVGSITLLQCSEDSFVTATQSCALFDKTDIKVINNAGFTIRIDVWLTGVGFLGEHYVGHGQSYTYQNVSASNAEFWAHNGSYWTWSDQTYNLTACQEFTFTWGSAKLEAAIPADKDLYRPIQ